MFPTQPQREVEILCRFSESNVRSAVMGLELEILNDSSLDAWAENKVLGHLMKWFPVFFDDNEEVLP